jgi:TRAP-type mannitol/chloroaromatic compound transport system permease small subunit
VYALIPLGFALLMLQGASELIKRVAFLKGQGPDALDQSGPSEAELLAKDIVEQEKARQVGAAA